MPVQDRHNLAGQSRSGRGEPTARGRSLSLRVDAEGGRPRSSLGLPPPSCRGSGDQWWKQGLRFQRPGCREWAKPPRPLPNSVGQIRQGQTALDPEPTFAYRSQPPVAARNARVLGRHRLVSPGIPFWHATRHCHSGWVRSVNAGMPIWRGLRHLSDDFLCAVRCAGVRRSGQIWRVPTTAPSPARVAAASSGTAADELAEGVSSGTASNATARRGAVFSLALGYRP